VNGKAEPDVVVIGGGLLGTATTFGLTGAGARVAVLDEGDMAFRASRANFALVWVQSKGLGLSAYAAWSKRSAALWRTFADQLEGETDIDLSLDQSGGFMLSVSDEEMSRRVDAMRRLHNQPGFAEYPYDVLSHAETKRRLPAIGPQVVGSIYCPLDGHVNSLRLFRALHRAMALRGVDYRPNAKVDSIRPLAGGFSVSGPWGEIRAPKVVLAAGLDNRRLAPFVGLDVPVQPSKGQIIVTERAPPFLRHATMVVRQTDEGSVMIGDSQEDAGFDTAVGIPVNTVMADRAVKMFPLLANLNVVRIWSALRVMSPDGFPIYDRSAEFPGAFVVTCHSGVTLAAVHALEIGPAIARGALPETVDCFSSRRFDVPVRA